MRFLIAIAILIVVGGCGIREEAYYIESGGGYTVFKNEQGDFDGIVIRCSTYEEARVYCDQLNKEAEVG